MVKEEAVTASGDVEIDVHPGELEYVLPGLKEGFAPFVVATLCVLAGVTVSIPCSKTSISATEIVEFQTARARESPKLDKNKNIDLPKYYIFMG